MVIDGDKRPKLGDFSIEELNAIVAEYERSQRALQDETDRLMADSQPLRDQIRALQAQLDPYREAIRQKEEAVKGIDWQIASIKGRVHQLEAEAERRRIQELRLARAQDAIGPLSNTALRLSETADPASSSLGRLIRRVLTSEEGRLAFPDLFEEDMSQHYDRNNGSRVMVGHGRDSVRLMFLLNGQVAVGYHPKTDTQLNTLGDILGQVTTPPGQRLDEHFIGFWADSENMTLRPFALAKKVVHEGYRRVTKIVSTPVDLALDDQRVLSIQSKVGDILTNGYASLRVDGERVTLPPQ